MTPKEQIAAHAPGNPMVPVPYRVMARCQESDDTVSLSLAKAEEGATANFVPGQFCMLYVFGVGEIPISISGDPKNPDRLIHTVRSVGAVSRAICCLKIGDMVGLRGPFGSGWPLEDAHGRDVIIVAGGIGLAPLRPAIYHVLQKPDRYGQVSILIGARTPLDLLFTNEYESWRDAGADVLVTVDAANETWRGDVGVVPGLVTRTRARPQRTVAMICGPEIMMRYTAHALRGRGVADGDIYVTMERNMKCAIGLCGHCQYGSDFLCKDGPVLPLARIAGRLFIPEI